MIPKRFQFHTFSFFMSLLMSGVMSFVMLTLESVTFIDVIEKWPGGWTISMLVAFPTSMLVVPLTQWLVSRVVAAN